MLALLSLWGSFLGMSAYTLAPYSMIRDFAGLFTKPLYIALTFSHAFLAFYLCLKRKGLITRLLLFFSTPAMLIGGVYLSQPLVDCFECRLPAMVQILSSKKCIDSVSINEFCVIYSEKYFDGHYYIARMENVNQSPFAAAKAFTHSDDVQAYALFDRYVVFRQPVPYYLGAFGSPYF